MGVDGAHGHAEAALRARRSSYDRTARIQFAGSARVVRVVVPCSSR